MVNINSLGIMGCIGIKMVIINYLGILGYYCIKMVVVNYFGIMGNDRNIGIIDGGGNWLNIY